GPDDHLCDDAGGDFRRCRVHGRQHLHRQRAQSDGQGHRGKPRRAHAELLRLHAVVVRHPGAALCCCHLHLLSLIMNKPKVLVARSIFPKSIARLEEHFEVETNQSDESWTKPQFIAKLKGKQGAFTTGSERIDAEVLDACPDLKICANMAVGYNNFDIDAMTA